MSVSATVGVEQLLIETFGLQKYGGVLLNKINSVANPSRSMNYTYTSATEAGAVALKKDDYEALLQVEKLVRDSGNPNVMFHYIGLKIMVLLAEPGESPQQWFNGVSDGLAIGNISWVSGCGFGTTIV
jgi:hypothetical protein